MVMLWSLQITFTSEYAPVTFWILFLISTEQSYTTYLQTMLE